MAVEESLNKTLYRLELYLIKIIPIILAGITLLNTILSYVGIDTPILSYIGGISFLTLGFLYLTSYVFRFCSWHRMALHYVLIINLRKVIIFYDVDYSYSEVIAKELLKNGFDAEYLEELWYTMQEGGGKAVTFSNLDKHISIVLFNKHDSLMDYLNSIVHEAEHIKQAMLEVYNVEDEGEAPAYTVGYIAMKILKVKLTH
jgi:hypothetical protein